MAFLFNEKINVKPSKLNSKQHSDQEYDALIKKESGLTFEQKNASDKRFAQKYDKGVGVLGTVVNTIKCSVGAGILSFPYGFYAAGWLGALVTIATVMLPIIFCLHKIGHTRRMLIEDRIRQQQTTGLRADPSITENEVKRLALESRDYLEFPDMGELSVGKKFSTLITGLVLMGQIGCCAAYVIYIANNLHTIGTSYVATSFLPRVVYIGAIFPLVLSLSFVKTLRGLMPIAVLGTLLLIGGLALVGTHGVQVAQASGKPLSMPPMFGENVVLFTGMALFSMESVTAMPVLQASMTQPSKFPKVLNWSVVGLVITYVAVGLGGAVLYGSTVDSVITRNMGMTVMGHVTRALFCATLLASFPFQLFPAATILERYLGSSNVDEAARQEEEERQRGGGEGGEGDRRNGGRSACHSLMTNYFVLRTMLCLVIVAIAIGFDDFGQFLSLIGYPCMGTLGLVIPPLMCLSLDMRSKEGRLTTFDRTLCWIIMCVGAVVCLCGTVYTIADMMSKHRSVAAAETGVPIKSSIQKLF